MIEDHVANKVWIPPVALEYTGRRLTAHTQALHLEFDSVVGIADNRYAL